MPIFGVLFFVLAGNPLGAGLSGINPRMVNPNMPNSGDPYGMQQSNAMGQNRMPNMGLGGMQRPPLQNTLGQVVFL